MVIDPSLYPLHVTSVAEETRVPAPALLRLTCSVTVQPFASVTSTEYEPGARPEILLVVAPVDHTTETTPFVEELSTIE